MDKFELLNRQTRDYNNRNVDRFNESYKSTGTQSYWLNQYNNNTYKENNGAYANHYSYR